MKQYDVIQDEVNSWGTANFGDNESPHFTIKMEPFPEGWKVGDPMPPSLVALGSMAPLMGIVEELGELFQADQPDDIADALGDVFIYLCDFAAREGFRLPIGRHLKVELQPLNLHGLNGMVAWVGRLHHAVLKRHQGIRGYDNDEKYQYHRDFCAAMILAYMGKVADHLLHDRLLVIANKTWNGVVSKRDWKKAPTDGGDHDHRS